MAEIRSQEQFEKVKAALKAGEFADDPAVQDEVIAAAEAWKAKATVEQPAIPDTGMRGFRADDPVRFGPGGFVDAVKDTAVGVGKAGLGLASALPSAVLGGYGGLFSLATGQGLDKAADTVRGIQKRGLYRPDDKVGASVTETLINPVELLSKGIDIGVGELPLPPSVQTGIKTGLEMVPALLGAKGFSRGQLSHQQKVLKEAQAEGYVVPTSSANPSSGSRGVLEGAVGGKPRMQQEASFKNQQVTNTLAARSLGLPEGTVITHDVLAGVRRQAGDAYSVLENSGVIVPTVVFRRDLSNAIKDLKKVTDDFSVFKKADNSVNEVIAIAEGLNKPTFHADSVVTATKLLRDEASTAFRNGQAQVGNAYRNISKALEDAAEAHLTRVGNPQAVQAFRDARVQIAKSYSIEKALDGDGFVSAAKLKGQRSKGEPLTGELDLIARFNEQFPQSSRVFKETPIKIGRLSGMLGAGGGGAALAGEPVAGALIAASALGGPLVRNALLSKAGQATVGKPVPPIYGVDNAIQGLIASGILSQQPEVK